MKYWHFCTCPWGPGKKLGSKGVPKWAQNGPPFLHPFRPPQLSKYDIIFGAQNGLIFLTPRSVFWSVFCPPPYFRNRTRPKHDFNYKTNTFSTISLSKPLFLQIPQKSSKILPRGSRNPSKISIYWLQYICQMKAWHLPDECSSGRWRPLFFCKMKTIHLADV